MEEVLGLGIGKYVKALRPVAAGLPGASHVTSWTTRKLGKHGAKILGDALESGASSGMKQIAQGETDLGKVARGAVAGGVARGVTGTVKAHLPERPGRDRVRDVVEDRVARRGVKRGLNALLDAVDNAARPSHRRGNAPSDLDSVTTAQGLHDWIAKVGPTRAAAELRQGGRKPLEITAIMEDHSSFGYPEISEEKIAEVTRPRGGLLRLW